MTDAELSRIEALAAEATPGPWGASSPHGTDWWAVDCNLPDVLTVTILRQGHSGYGRYGEAGANAAFIAACRVAVPALCVALREARALLLRLEDDDLVRIGREGERAACVEAMRRGEKDSASQMAAAREKGDRHMAVVWGSHERAYGTAAVVIAARGPLARLPADALEAENARLREALREMVRVHEDDRADAHDLDQARHAARKALGEGSC